MTQAIQEVFGRALREVAQKEEGKHVVAKIIRVHRSAQLIGDAPERAAELFLIKEPLINHASVSVFLDHGNPDLISAIVDRFPRYSRGRNARLDPLQTQITRHA